MQNTDEYLTIQSQTIGQFTPLNDREFIDTQFHQWTFGGVEFNNCTFRNVISNSKTPSFFWCCVFNQSIMDGNIGKIKLNAVRHFDDKQSSNAVWIRKLKEYYSSVDYALDITNAYFTTSIDLNCIPGDKIKTNREDQVVIPLNTLKDNFDMIDWGNSSWKVACQWAINDKIHDYVCIFPCGKGTARKCDVELIEFLKRKNLHSK